MVKKITQRSVFVAVLCVMLMACKNSSTKTIQPEDFDEFYQKFLTNEEFQLSRIEFPLDGCETDNDTVIYWNSAADWTMLIESVYDIDTIEYKVEKIFSPAKVVFKIYIEDSGYGITQEYEQEEGKWYLIMYDSMSN